MTSIQVIILNKNRGGLRTSLGNRPLAAEEMASTDPAGGKGGSRSIKLAGLLLFPGKVVV